MLKLIMATPSGLIYGKVKQTGNQHTFEVFEPYLIHVNADPTNQTRVQIQFQPVTMFGEEDAPIKITKSQIFYKYEPSQKFLDMFKDWEQKRKMENLGIVKPSSVDRSLMNSLNKDKR